MRKSRPGSSRSAAALLPGRERGELVAAVIVLVRCVTLGPGPVGLMLLVVEFELLPEVLVDHGRLGLGHPAVALPVLYPGRDPVLHVFGIGNNVDPASLLQRRQPFNG